MTMTDERKTGENAGGEEDQSLTAAGGFEEARHPRDTKGRFRRLDVIMRDLRTAGSMGSGLTQGHIWNANTAIAAGDRTKARTELQAAADSTANGQIKSLAAEATDRLKSLKVSKARIVPTSNHSTPDQISDVSHPDHGHIGTITKATRSSDVMSGPIRTGSTNYTRYRANPEGEPGTVRSGTAGVTKEFRTRAQAAHHLAEQADHKARVDAGLVSEHPVSDLTPIDPNAPQSQDSHPLPYGAPGSRWVAPAPGSEVRASDGRTGIASGPVRPSGDGGMTVPVEWNPDSAPSEPNAPAVPEAPAVPAEPKPRSDRMQAMLDSAKHEAAGSPAPSVHLQGIGKHPAKPVSEFKPGDKVVHNYGETSTVVSNTKMSPPSGHHQLIVRDKNGKEYTNRRAGTTLLGHREGTPPEAPAESAPNAPAAPEAPIPGEREHPASAQALRDSGFKVGDRVQHNMRSRDHTGKVSQTVQPHVHEIAGVSRNGNAVLRHPETGSTYHAPINDLIKARPADAPSAPEPGGMEAARQRGLQKVADATVEGRARMNAPAAPAADSRVTSVPSEPSRQGIKASDLREGDQIAHPKTGEPVTVTSARTHGQPAIRQTSVGYTDAKGSRRTFDSAPNQVHPLASPAEPSAPAPEGSRGVRDYETMRGIANITPETRQKMAESKQRSDAGTLDHAQKEFPEGTRVAYGTGQAVDPPTHTGVVTGHTSVGLLKIRSDQTGKDLPPSGFQHPRQVTKMGAPSESAPSAEEHTQVAPGDLQPGDKLTMDSPRMADRGKIRDYTVTGHSDRGGRKFVHMQADDGKVDQVPHDHMPPAVHVRRAPAAPEQNASATITNQPKQPVDVRDAAQQHDTPTLRRMAQDGNLRPQDRQTIQDELNRRNAGVQAPNRAMPDSGMGGPVGDTLNRQAAGQPMAASEDPSEIDSLAADGTQNAMDLGYDASTPEGESADSVFEAIQNTDGSAQQKIEAGIEEANRLESDNPQGREGALAVLRSVMHADGQQAEHAVPVGGAAPGEPGGGDIPSAPGGTNEPDLGATESHYPDTASAKAGMQDGLDDINRTQDGEWEATGDNTVEGYADGGNATVTRNPDGTYTADISAVDDNGSEIASATHTYPADTSWPDAIHQAHGAITPLWEEADSYGHTGRSDTGSEPDLGTDPVAEAESPHDMVKNTWGDTPWSQIPADYKTTGPGGERKVLARTRDGGTTLVPWTGGQRQPDNSPEIGSPPISNADKIRNAETMYGTDSPQHQEAQRRFGGAPDPERAAMRDSADGLRNGRSAKMQRAFRAASEGDHQWLSEHGFDAQPGDSIHAHHDTGFLGFGKPDGSYSVQQVNGNGGAGRQGMQVDPSVGHLPPGFEQVHDPGASGVPSDIGGEAEEQALRDRVAQANGGRSAKAERAFRAAREGDHAWLASHGFNAGPNTEAHIDDANNRLAFKRTDGTWSAHGVNGNGQATSPSYVGKGQIPSNGSGDLPEGFVPAGGPQSPAEPPGATNVGAEANRATGETKQVNYADASARIDAALRDSGNANYNADTLDSNKVRIALADPNGSDAYVTVKPPGGYEVSISRADAEALLRARRVPIPPRRPKAPAAEAADLTPTSAPAVAQVLKRAGIMTSHDRKRQSVRVSGGGAGAFAGPVRISVDYDNPEGRHAQDAADAIEKALSDAGYTVERDGTYFTVKGRTARPKA